MSIKYPWLPEMFAAPLRSLRNRVIRGQPTRAEFDALTEELRRANADLAAKRQQYVALTNLVIDAARACRDDPVAIAAFEWIKNNEYVLSGATAWGKKTEKSFSELIESVDRASNRELAK